MANVEKRESLEDFSDDTIFECTCAPMSMQD